MLVARPLVSVLAASSSTSSLRMSSSSLFTKPVVQYIFVRRDLDWPTGAVAAQAAHASVAAIVQGRDDPATQYYTSPDQLPHMTKYVYGVDSVEELTRIQGEWESKFGNTYHLWMEEPEHVPTALATWPVERTNAVSKVVKKMEVTFL